LPVFFFSIPEVLFKVNRDSPTERIRDFVDMGVGVQNKLKFLRTLEGNFLSAIITTNVLYIHFAILFWSWLINIFMIATWEAAGDLQDPLPYVEAWYLPTIYALGAVHLFLSLLVVVGHFLTDPPIQFGVLTQFNHKRKRKQTSNNLVFQRNSQNAPEVEKEEAEEIEDVDEKKPVAPTGKKTKKAKKL